MNAYLDKFRRGAQPYLPPGEEIIAGFVARPRGWSQAVAGNARYGMAQQDRAYAAGEASGLVLASPMALALTPRSLLVLSIGSPIGLGIGGAVKGIASSVPLADVDAVSMRRLLLGKIVTVTVRGVPVQLDANAMADVRGLIDAFNRIKRGDAAPTTGG